jgi:hypothetical protein
MARKTRVWIRRKASDSFAKQAFTSDKSLTNSSSARAKRFFFSRTGRDACPERKRRGRHTDAALGVFHASHAYVSASSIQSVARNHGVPHENPLYVQSESGHKRGVGKNRLVCVGRSMRMCNGQPKSKSGNQGFHNHSAPSAIAQITSECVQLYEVNTHEGIVSNAGGPRCNVKPFESIVSVNKIPNESRSGNAPTMPNHHRFGCCQYNGTVHR